MRVVLVPAAQVHEQPADARSLTWAFLPHAHLPISRLFTWTRLSIRRAAFSSIACLRRVLSLQAPLSPAHVQLWSRNVEPKAAKCDVARTCSHYALPARVALPARAGRRAGALAAFSLGGTFSSAAAPSSARALDDSVSSSAAWMP
eukprot:CAMPEP_0174733166 /NCGR_PEP_ID=MMETSP1094-20130205/60800_1 /TAXON_ID=156173 /ORGANISM="Chrysochromulina brevifilum, Strain UTEX LB 985" /LENGTH=145 /DNA_ID=CAMNT_0015935789 /DNA_START=166 /DNA_END=603 /DNA_ORIENTATION=-